MSRFTKATFPEKWKIKDCKIVARYASKRFKCSDNVYASFCCVDELINNFWFLDKDDDASEIYEEITFKEFEEFVLNKDKPREVIIKDYTHLLNLLIKLNIR